MVVIALTWSPPLSEVCTHLSQINPDAQPQTPEGCAECLKEKKRWIALRMCLTCGHIGCCDSNVGQHARAHWEETGHAIMKSYKAPEFTWCYIDDMMVKVPTTAAKS
jgi:uncharacterized UBP type Zn finger protein